MLSGFIRILHRLGVGEGMWYRDSVGLQNLKNPGNKLRDPGVHAWREWEAPATAPGHDAHQGPGAILLAD